MTQLNSLTYFTKVPHAHVHLQGCPLFLFLQARQMPFWAQIVLKFRTAFVTASCNVVPTDLSLIYRKCVRAVCALVCNPSGCGMS